MAGKETIEPPHLLRAAEWQFEYRQKTNPRTSNLKSLSYGTYRIVPAAISDDLCHHGEEALLFCISGRVVVEIAGQEQCLGHYDVLYVPLRTPYRIANRADEEAMLVVCRAPAENVHKVEYAGWQDYSQKEERIRHLQGKDVYLMFDVTEKADKLMAGYTIYEPHTRAWPAHNHTDQEEIYIFIKGQGAMEVYADEEHKTFVHSMQAMDAATIPLLNYHPVFSQEQELHFIWCISGERYWVGDKDQSFMKGDSATLTT